jgi:prepilin-type N-terminal cleavage/methylation domain-containing protein
MMTTVGRLRARLHGEDGFTLVELLVALSILSIAFFALAAAASTGLRVVAEGRQREAATEIANGRLEHLRNIPYANAELDSQPLHSSV